MYYIYFTIKASKYLRGAATNILRNSHHNLNIRLFCMVFVFGRH